MVPRIHLWFGLGTFILLISAFLYLGIKAVEGTSLAIELKETVIQMECPIKQLEEILFEYEVQRCECFSDNKVNCVVFEESTGETYYLEGEITWDGLND